MRRIVTDSSSSLAWIAQLTTQKRQLEGVLVHARAGVSVIQGLATQV